MAQCNQSESNDEWNKINEEQKSKMSTNYEHEESIDNTIDMRK